MPLDSELLSILACPKCKGDLTLAGDDKSLICESCKLAYPVREGIPVMLSEEAVPLGAALARSVSVSPTEIPAGAEKVRFAVVEGKGKGSEILLAKGMCRAIGRSLDDMERTRVFSVDSSVGLDESSKKLVMTFISKQFRKSSPSTDESHLGGFVRGPDFQLPDGAVSRLHAMVFYDEGGVGILDLVSRNGTFVNGAEVESKILKSGDLITIGGSKLRYEGTRSK